MVLIRADANIAVGMGHVMRCLSIADAFSNLGHDVCFILADDEVSFLIQERGYERIVLHSDYQSMESELQYWPSLEGADYIIVDSYYVTASYLRSLREKTRCVGGKLVYIDDVCQFPYPVDILVDYNVYAAPATYEELYRGLEKPQFILGPAYAPLRSMFRGIPKRTQPESVHNILVSTGGSDELHLARSTIRYLLQSHLDERRYHFLLGAMNTDKEEIKQFSADKDYLVLHENVSDMKSLIVGMDLVVSAAGSTLYEICACGVPLITYSIADNQILGAESFERLGLGINVGDLRNPNTIDPELVISGKLDESAAEWLMKAGEKLAEDYIKRIEMGSRMQSIVDGFGADRMIQAIMQ